MPRAKGDAKFCGTCGDGLSDANWFPSFKKGNIARCKSCHSIKAVGMTYCPQCGLLLRDGLCESCYDPHCQKCDAQLTEANWYPAHRKRGLLRCNTCHGVIIGAWQKANPESARQRTARWRERNPEHGKQYYQDNIEHHAERARKLLWQYKIAAINLLGGKCVVCHVEDMRILQVNHKNGGGTQEKRFGIDMYKAIVQGVRTIEDLDVRCANHNLLYEYERGKRKLPAGLDFDTVTVKESSI